MKVTQLGETNHLSWLADVEQVCKLNDCWDAVVTPIPDADQLLLDALVTTPNKTVLTMTLSNSAASLEDKASATALLGALEWRRKDQVAQAILKLNLEDGKHGALKGCASANAVYNQFVDSFSSRGKTGKTQLSRRLLSHKKAPKEAMETYINRVSVLRIEMRRMGINTAEDEVIAALLAGLPATYANTVELIEHHGPEDLPGVTRRRLGAELKRRGLEQDEDEAVALAAAAAAAAPRAPRAPPTAAPAAPAMAPYHPMMQGYGAGIQCQHLPLYYPSPPAQNYLGGQTTMPPMDAYPGYGYPAPVGNSMAGQGGRPPRRCWGCGVAGHMQRHCRTHPLPVDLASAGVRPVAAPPPMPAAMYAAGAGALPPGYMPPWGLPVPPPVRQGAPAAHIARDARPAQAPDPAPPRPAHGGQPAAPGRGWLALMAFDEGHGCTSGGDWIIDSGASHHMAPTSVGLTNVHNIDTLRITMAGGQTVEATRAGDAVATIDGESGEIPVTLNDFVIVPGLAVNLISVRAMTKKGYGAFFHKDGLDMVGQAGVLFRGEERGNVWVLPTAYVSWPAPADNVGTAAFAATAPTWHNRLAHAGRRAVMQTAKAVKG